MVALSMADGFARLTGKPQCVIVHVDVGTVGLLYLSLLSTFQFIVPLDLEMGPKLSESLFHQSYKMLVVKDELPDALEIIYKNVVSSTTRSQHSHCLLIDSICWKRSPKLILDVVARSRCCSPQCELRSSSRTHLCRPLTLYT